MLELDKLSFGDTIYYLNESINTLIRSKIYMTDEKGVEWYRYSKPVYTYTIEHHEYVGRAEVVVLGTVDKETLDHTKYFFKSKETGDLDYLIKHSANIHWFQRIEDAETVKTQLEQQALELDRT